jgi:hypothetical protein
MFKQLKVKSFKSVTDVEIKLKKLNLFLGTNSSGKSSVLQSILVLSQADKLNYKNDEMTTNTVLNGDFIRLGNYNEIKSKKATDDIQISLRDYNNVFKLSISRDIVYYDVNEHFFNKVKYISADRIGAKDVYPESFSEEQYFQSNGQYLFSFLQKNKKLSLNEDFVMNQDGSNTLLVELNYWLNKILDTKLKIEEIEQTDLVKVTYDVRGNIISNRPKNLGTGTSFIISILILCLGSQEGDVLLIENPELHLHPKAQSALTDFLIHIAEHNRQLFIETHSDHVFNAIRVAISRDQSDDKKNSQELFGINFVELDEEFKTLNHEIEVKGKGDVINPQDGLFDQFDNDLLRMLGL